MAIKETVLKLANTSVEALKKVEQAVIKPAGTTTSSTSRMVTLVSTKSFASQVKSENTVYCVKYDFNLAGGNVVLPKKCTLDFRGGTLKNGVLTGNDSTIHADRKVFKPRYKRGYRGQSRSTAYPGSFKDADLYKGCGGEFRFCSGLCSLGKR